MMEKFTRRQIDRIENGIIALLVCTALFLVGKTGLFQAVGGQDTGVLGGTTAVGVQDTALARGTPVRLMAQTTQGRYGLQYDQTAVNDLYAQGLGTLLTQALAVGNDPTACTWDTWQQAVTQGESWIYYDFLYDVSFGGGEEKGRSFLITARSGTAEAIYYYDQGTDILCTASLRGAQIALPTSLEALTPNGGKFAFEAAEVADVLPGYMMVLPRPPACPVYQVRTPGIGDTNQLLETLSFNPLAASIYQTADSTVIREGTDTLRFQTDGTISYHGPSGNEARFQALGYGVSQLQSRAEEILSALLAEYPSQGTFRCQSVETQADGRVEVTYCWMLHGAPVQLWEDGWAARFVFQGTHLTSFEIHLRQYEATDIPCAVLPEIQAAAAAETMGKTGEELQLCYRDDGANSDISAVWAARETGQGG